MIEVLRDNEGRFIKGHLVPENWREKHSAFMREAFKNGYILPYSHWEGKNLSENHRKNIGIGNEGRKVSKKTREKISEKLRGKPKSKEHIKKMIELRTRKLPKKSKILSKELGYILGVISGDGYIYKNFHVGLNVRDYDFALAFKNALEKWISFPVFIYKGNSGTPFRVRLNSKEVCQFLNNFDLNKLKESSSKIKAEFIKGFFDSEGCFYEPRFRTLMSNTDKNLLLFIQTLLNAFNIKSHIYKSSSKGKIGILKNGNIIRSRKKCFSLCLFKEESKKFFSMIGTNIARKRWNFEN
jgi:intein-encoded DNA endonuclease-like protein